MPGAGRKPGKTGAASQEAPAPTTPSKGVEPRASTKETRFQRVIRIVDEAVNKAKETRDWVTVDLVEVNNWRLRININPSGIPALVLQAPSLRNRLVLRDEEAIRTVIDILQSFLDDRELKDAVFSALAKHGFRPRTRGVVIRL